MPSVATASIAVPDLRQPLSTSATAAATSNKLGASTSECRTLMHTPWEKSTPAQRKKLPRLFSGNQRHSNAANKSQLPTFSIG